MEKITPFIVMDILKKAREMPDAVHMEVGEPDLPPSPRVEDAFVKAIRDRRFFYTSACGLWELRKKISEHYLKTYNVDVSPERIIITPGTSGAFLIVLALFVERGKRLILSDPSYPCYKNFAYFLGIEPYFIPVEKETNYEIMPEMIKNIDNIGALMVSSPANPTGNLYKVDTLRKLVEFCKEHKIWLISDEIYHGLVYDEKEFTALDFSQDAIVINGFSKYFCMPGFRLGWVIFPEDFVRKAEILIQNIFIAASTPAQYAALEAFDYKYLEIVKNTFRERRNLLYAELKDIFEISLKPEGAFYIWTDISRYEDDSVRFCNLLLEKKAVAVTPGVDFGRNKTDRYVRFAYTTNISHLREGVRRIREFVQDISFK
ncbi:MAG: aminotransferase class I/II-fold pyridoxal phosphate-dependent enzyme [Nitrospirota bacterium]